MVDGFERRRTRYEGVKHLLGTRDMMEIDDYAIDAAMRWGKWAYLSIL